MIRRSVDICIPAAAAVGTWGPALHLVPMPPSMNQYAGSLATYIWLATLALSFTAISVGVVLSKRNPAAAFRLEAIPFSYVGLIFCIHVIALFYVNGLAAWSAGWWEIGIVGYCVFRGIELYDSLTKARLLERERTLQRDRPK